MSSHVTPSPANPRHSASARAVLAELLHHPLAGHCRPMSTRWPDIGRPSFGRYCA